MTSINTDLYRVNIKTIAEFLHDKTDAQRLESIGKLAIMTGAPIIVVGVYIRELYGDIPGLSTQISRLMDFYKIDSIENERK